MTDMVEALACNEMGFMGLVRFLVQSREVCVLLPSLLAKGIFACQKANDMSGLFYPSFYQQ